MVSSDEEAGDDTAWQLEGETIESDLELKLHVLGFNGLWTQKLACIQMPKASNSMRSNIASCVEGSWTRIGPQAHQNCPRDTCRRAI